MTQNADPFITQMEAASSSMDQRMLAENVALKKRILALQHQLTQYKDHLKPTPEAVAHVKEVRLWVYYVKTQMPEGWNCPVCEHYLENYADQVKNLWQIIGLPKEKYRYRDMPCDWAERFFDQHPYGKSFTTWGKNWLEAEGRDITKYPSIELWTDVYIENKKKEKQVATIYQYLHGFGRRDPPDRFGRRATNTDLITPLKRYFTNIYRGIYTVPLEMILHKEHINQSDVLMDIDHNPHHD